MCQIQHRNQTVAAVALIVNISTGRAIGTAALGGGKLTLKKREE